METVLIRLAHTGETHIRKLHALPSAGDTIGIYVDGKPMTLRVSHVHHSQYGECTDSTPIVHCVEIAEVTTDEHQ